MKIKSYSRIRKKAEESGLPAVRVPNLLAMQKDSYDKFDKWNDINNSKKLFFY